MNIAEFCDQHDACEEGRKWALANCADMADAWATAKPEWLLWIAVQPGVLTDREIRIFAYRCARGAQDTFWAFSLIETLVAAEDGDLRIVTTWIARNARSEPATKFAQAEYLRANCKPNFENRMEKENA